MAKRVEGIEYKLSINLPLLVVRLSPVSSNSNLVSILLPGLIPCLLGSVWDFRLLIMLLVSPEYIEDLVSGTTILEGGLLKPGRYELLITAAVETFFRGLRRKCALFVEIFLFTLILVLFLINLELMLALVVFLLHSGFSVTLTVEASSESEDE